MCGNVVTNVRTHHTSTMSDILLYFCENTVGFRAAFDAVVKDGLCEMLFKRSVNADGIFAVGIVYPYVYRLGCALASIHEAACIGIDLVIFAVAEYGKLSAQRAQFLIERKQFFVRMQPIETAAAERVLIALHGVFVAIIDAGNARERELQDGRHHDALLCRGLFALGKERDRHFILIGTIFSAEHRKDTRRIVRSENIHEAVECLFRVIVHEHEQRFPQL